MLGCLDKKATQSSCFGFRTWVAKESANKRIANFSVFEGNCCVTLLGDTHLLYGHIKLFWLVHWTRIESCHNTSKATTKQGPNLASKNFWSEPSSGHQAYEKKISCNLTQIWYGGWNWDLVLPPAIWAESETKKICPSSQLFVMAFKTWHEHPPFFIKSIMWSTLGLLRI